MKIYPVIMCGGAGTRLWPVSTQDNPKQFHPLVTDRSVFQDTVLRFSTGEHAAAFAPPVVISNGRHERLVEQQLAEIGVSPAAIILEPVGRNTAAVAALAAKFVQDLDPGALAILLPSDHFIGKPDAFCKAVLDAAGTAQAGRIVTFGIQPTRPDTGFGYIQAGEPLSGRIRKVAAFREKPDFETASRYIADGDYSWNAGIFLFAPETMLAELRAHAPDVLDRAGAALAAADLARGSIALDRDKFETVPSISVDYAVMEHTTQAAVFGPLDCQWSDIGTWGVISDLRREDSPETPVEIDSRNCSVHADGGQLVALVGVENICVVVEGDRILVTSKDRTQDVGKVVAALRDAGRSDQV